MGIGLLGVDHTVVDITHMEPIFLNKDGKQAFRERVLESDIISEFVVLTTCNRIEFYFVSDDFDEGKMWIVQNLSDQKQVDQDLVTTLLKSYNAEQTIQHLFEVSSGVQSMVFGENEILTQVKDAYEDSLSQKLTGPLLNKCFQMAIAVGKRVRTETGISRGAYSVSSIAVDAVRQKRLDYFGKSILIIGMGTMGRRCLTKLHALGHPDITIANRTESTADSLASQFDVRVLPFNDLDHNVGKFDIIISAITTKKPLLSETYFVKDKKYLTVDLGLPRNVDESLHQWGNIDLVNVEGLKEIAQANVRKRQAELSKVEFIIDDEMNRFKHWLTHKRNHEAAS